MEQTKLVFNEIVMRSDLYNTNMLSGNGMVLFDLSGQTKDYTIVICCFADKHAVLRRKTKDWLARNQDNVSEWGDMSFYGLLFQ
jgi:hypothetical protein